jgi:HK97 family phage prohead protease
MVRLMDFAASPFEIKTLSDSGAIEGILAGFGDVDHGGDKLLPGCLSKSLSTRSAPLPMLLHHDMKRPIGAWKSWEERPEGLFVKGALTLATRDAQEAHALAKDGALTGLSIGWKPIKESTDQKGVRTVTEAELFEGSLVAVPMHDRARVTAIKSITSAGDIRELLREAGLSGHKAKAAAGAAWKAINEADPDELDPETVDLLTSSAARIAAIGATR